MLKKVWMVGVLALAGTVEAYAAYGTVELKGTESNSPIQGTIALEDVMDGVKVSLKVSGLPPGPHGFHVHEFGSCANKGLAAGGHYNPRGTMHGQVLKQGSSNAHSGDMGNLKADAKGNASMDLVLPGLALTGKGESLVGRAFIIHEKADDFSQPVGNAGGRIACGPVVLIQDPNAAAH